MRRNRAHLKQARKNLEKSSTGLSLSLSLPVCSALPLIARYDSNRLALLLLLHMKSTCLHTSNASIFVLFLDFSVFLPCFSSAAATSPWTKLSNKLAPKSLTTISHCNLLSLTAASILVPSTLSKRAQAKRWRDLPFASVSRLHKLIDD